MRNDKVFHIISNTHWDREWRFPFQRNRQMLVEMIDDVLDILTREPEYRAFHLDSQSIVLTDYLEVKPHKKELIKKLVEDKRLFIGPWFILPDEFLVGGENLIRNILLGHKICKEMGGVSKIGYSPFSWGQISQLPQIYDQFGINLIMFYRGVNSLDSYHAEFIWEGADGTQKLSSRFSTMPRYNFYFYIYRKVIHNEGFSDVEYKWSNGGVPFHFADQSLHHEDYFNVNPADNYFFDNIETSVKSIIEKQADDFTTPHVIWMEGHDSSGPNIKTVQIIKDIKKVFPDINVIHSTLEDYAEAVSSSSDFDKLAFVKGERRSAQYDLRSGNLYGYVTSARMYLKVKNFEAEKWLQYYAEPFYNLADINGFDANSKYLDIAWNYLIQNSAHDSIGGCSLDEIHEDMMSRYKQIIEISQGVYEKSLKHFVKNINLTTQQDANLNLVVFNPLPYPRSETVEAFIDIPLEYDKGDFDIVSFNGEKLEKAITEITEVKPVFEQLIDRPMYFDMKRYRTHVKFDRIVEMGYTSFKIIPRETEKMKINFTGFLKKKHVYLENQFLKVKVNKDGTLRVHDKVSKQAFNCLGYFYDEGEEGHAWVHEPITPVLITLESSPKIRLLENNELSATVAISHQLKRIDYNDISSKKPKKKKIDIQLFVTLRKDSKKLEFIIEVDNYAENHRLRIMFPTAINTVKHFAQGQFDVVERTTARAKTKEWVEQPMYDFPFHHFVDVSNFKFGAAFFANGLKEYEMLNDKNRTIAFTLIRAFKYIIQPSSVEDYSHQKGSQCLGKCTCKMAFYPHNFTWDKSDVYTEALKFNTPLGLVQCGNSSGNLPHENSFLKIDNPMLIYDAFKKAEDENGFVLRLHNPTSELIKSKINFFNNLIYAATSNLEEKWLGDLEIQNNSIEISVAPKKIVSIRLKFNQ
ncbi:MAG TPA: glycoside hydrolase family 38 C-terminal domain-containing protein [Ignavibacteriaceae bacterium]|nr:glycoside hydrolase family 38 C-terminal domain-containing protein [Ignavibacteriaceae bacterium]